MKKFTFPLLLGSSLLFGIHHTYAEDTIATKKISVEDLQSDSTRSYMYDVLEPMLSTMYGRSITGCTISIPEVPANTNFKGLIKINKDNQSWPIDYQISNYDNLSDLNKKLFDHFQFDKNKFVTIIGFEGTYNSTLINYVLNPIIPKQGSFTVGKDTKFLKWNKGLNGTQYLNSCSKFRWNRSKEFYWEE